MLFVITVLLITLKLAHVITWSWLICFLPLAIGIAVPLILMAFATTVAVIAALLGTESSTASGVKK